MRFPWCLQSHIKRKNVSSKIPLPRSPTLASGIPQPFKTNINRRFKILFLSVKKCNFRTIYSDVALAIQTALKIVRNSKIEANLTYLH